MNSHKSLRTWIVFALCAVVALSAVSCSKKETKLIPIEILAGNPDRITPRLSPDGTLMAYIAPDNGVLNVWVKTIGKDDDRAVTKDTNRGIRRYFWAKDNTHIMYMQDVGGNENWRLYGANLATSEIKDFTPFDEVQVRVLAVDKKFPNELLIEMNKENPRVHDVYNLNLTTAELKLVGRNPGNVVGWLQNPNFKVLCATAATPDGGFDLLFRASEDATWDKLLTWDADNGLNSEVLEFTGDGKGLYLIDSRDANAGRLVKLNIETGEIETIAQDSQFDVSRTLIHPDTRTVQAVAFMRARIDWQVLDVSIADDFKAIAKLDDGDFFIIDRDDADATWLIGFTQDDGPVTFYAFNREQGKGTFLFSHMPALKDYKLAPMEPVSFESRDGLTIHGYMTCPVGKPRKDLPMVLNVHGGPWARDAWGYDYQSQWLANRGYICFQVNFRGSTGYGKDFVNAGDREWGAKMHDDLVDAVNWAVEQGYADPKKVAIYGGSYGGYAALVGATFTPDLFCCAVDVVGPSNLITLIHSVPPYWSSLLATFHKRIGDPATEEEFLKSRSPLFKVDQIKIPILIAQGANDPRVKQAEAEQIVAAMKEKGLEYEYMLFPDEGHGFAKPENRIKFMLAAEKFLAKHLGGRFEEAKGK
jgi:dipeptidyl aminopeptidase/acylaminoacyl peptidase